MARVLSRHTSSYKSVKRSKTTLLRTPLKGLVLNKIILGLQQQRHSESKSAQNSKPMQPFTPFNCLSNKSAQQKVTFTCAWLYVGVHLPTRRTERVADRRKVYSMCLNALILDQRTRSQKMFPLCKKLRGKNI